MDFEFGNEQGGDAGGWDGNDEGGANNDGGARVGYEDDLERVTKASKETLYGVEKGCLTHCTLLHFVLELLILKAKYG